MASGIPYTPRPITDIFTPFDTEIDRRKCTRVVPMRVLALGLGRTGTASLRIALQELGYNDTYHMMNASVENPPDCLMWQDAFASKFDGKGEFTRKHWDQLLGHCQAVCDWPAVAFAKELIEAYPEAKVILTTRDVDSWHASTMKTVSWRANDRDLKWLSKYDWASNLYYPMLRRFWECFWPNGDFENHGKARFHEYYEEVRSLVPKDNLLEYKITSGWDPLCEFLGHEKPDRVFPNSNDNHSFVARCQARNRNQLKNVAFRYMVLGGSLVATALSAAVAYQQLVPTTFGSLISPVSSSA